MSLNLEILNQKSTINQIIKNNKLILKMRRDCKNGKVIILKQVFSNKILNNVLKKNYLYFKNKKQFVPKEYNSQKKDFFRVDKNPKKSKIKKFQIIYFYPLRNKNKDYIRNFVQKISILRNKIAGLKKNYGENINDKHCGFGTIQHYPNNGFMSEHRDPKLPQKVVVSVIVEDNYEQGGLAIKKHSEFINVDNFLKKGDIVVHPADVLHKVEKIFTKSKKPLAGRWRATSILIPST